MDVKLVMFTAEGERRDFPLRHPKTTLGRNRNCGLRVPILSVSREHARIEQREDGVYLRDLGSSNGTYVNEDRVQVQKIEAGDTFRIGPVSFTLVVNGKPAKIEPVKTVLPNEDTGEQEAQGAAASRGPGDSDLLRPAAEEEDEETIEILDDEEESPPRKSRPEAPLATSNGSAEPAPAKRTSETAEEDKDEDPISALESIAPDEEGEDEDDYNNASDTFDAIFGTGDDDDDDSVPVFDDDDKKKP